MKADTSRRLLGIAFLIISGFVVLLLAAYGFETLIQSFAELALILVGALVTIGLQLLFSKKSTIERNPQFYWTDVQLIRSVITDKVAELPDLSYLNIHYSKRKDGPDNPHRPYYVENVKTNKAYWVRPELRVLARRGIIQGVPHDNENELVEYLKTKGIELVKGGRYSLKGELDVP